MDTKELATKTADELERRGKIESAFYDRDGFMLQSRFRQTGSPKDDDPAFVEWRKACRVCFVGAVAAVVEGDPLRFASNRVTHAVNGLAVALNIDGLADWPDDDPGTYRDEVRSTVYRWSDATSEADVIEALRRVAS